MTSSARIRKLSAEKTKSNSGKESGGTGRRRRTSSPSLKNRKGSPSGGGSSTAGSSKDTESKVAAETEELDSGMDEAFEDHTDLSGRIAKTLYFANKMPSTPRPSFPLTVLAVNAFTSGTLGTKLDSLEFLDLEMASEIGRNACVTPTSLIMALVYLDRLSQNNQTYLSTVNPSELFVVALLVASKFMQDDGEECGIYNDEWASSANMDVKRVNRLELKFLDAMDWRINVNLEEYNKVLKSVEQKLAVQQGNSRGWFTYTELQSLSATILAWNSVWPLLYHYTIQVVVAASITYTALVATMVTSSILIPQLMVLSKGLMTSTNSILIGNTRNLLPMHLTNTQPQLNFVSELDLTDDEECNLLPDDLNLHLSFRLGRNNETLLFPHLKLLGHLEDNLKHQFLPSRYYARSADTHKQWTDALEDGMRTQLNRFIRPTMQNYQHLFGTKEIHFLHSFDSRDGSIINM